MSTPTHSLSHETHDCDTALLIIDMVSDWQFDEGALLLAQARPIAGAIGGLKRRCRAAGVPVIYANDNQGRWRSDFRAQVQRSLDGPGADITQALMPDDDDYFLLKPKHSAFFCTPLDLLLEDLKVKRLLLAGVATDQCIATTAVDARMRNYEVVVPWDCTATQSSERQARMERHFADALRVPTPPADQVVLRRQDMGNNDR